MTHESVLAELAALDQLAAEDARVCSRIRWAKEGESSSYCFLQSGKKKRADAWISAMKKADGEVVSDLDGILDSWHNFYSSLFTSCHMDAEVQARLFEI